MSNRKENLKKSLGITDYILSSEEEDDDDTQNVGSRPRMFTNENNSANSSRLLDPNKGQAPQPALALSPIRRTQTRIQSEDSWSFLNNGIRMSILDPAHPGPSSSCQGMDMQSNTSCTESLLAFSKMPRWARPKLQSTLIRMTPPIDVTVPEPNLNKTMRAQDFEPEEDETDIRSRLYMSQEAMSLDDNAENVNTEPQPENANSEMVVEVESDMVVVDSGGADNTHNDDRTNEQANEEPSTSNNAAELQPVRQGVNRRNDGDELEEDDINTVNEFNASMLHLLECPVCMECMEPPMLLCRRGHLVCRPCRRRLSACPVCRTAFSSVRNWAMESVAELLRYPCRHGCGREVRLRRRVLHEASCAARRYLCPVSPCVERTFQLDELHHHAKACHQSILKGWRHKFSVRMTAKKHDTWLMMAARELFHLRVDVDGCMGGWGFMVYVAYIGPHCNAKNFTYEVTVTGRHNNWKLVYARATHSSLESPSVNVSRRDCFNMTLAQALNFLRMKNRHCEPETYLDFVVDIIEIEAPPAAPRDSSDS